MSCFRLLFYPRQRGWWSSKRHRAGRPRGGPSAPSCSGAGDAGGRAGIAHGSCTSPALGGSGLAALLPAEQPAEAEASEVHLAAEPAGPNGPEPQSQSQPLVEAPAAPVDVPLPPLPPPPPAAGLVQDGPDAGYVTVPLPDGRQVRVGRLKEFPRRRVANLSVTCSIHGSVCGRIWQRRRAPDLERLREWLRLARGMPAEAHKACCPK